MISSYHYFKKSLNKLRSVGQYRRYIEIALVLERKPCLRGTALLSHFCASPALTSSKQKQLHQPRSPSMLTDEPTKFTAIFCFPPPTMR